MLTLRGALSHVLPLASPHLLWGCTGMAAVVVAPANGPPDPSLRRGHQHVPYAKTYVMTSVPATYARTSRSPSMTVRRRSGLPRYSNILKRTAYTRPSSWSVRNARAYPSLVRRVVAEVHTVATTATATQHDDLVQHTQAASMDNTTNYISAAISGGYTTVLLPPPYGAYNSTTFRLATARGMTMVNWSRDTRDWQTPLHLSRSFQTTIVSRATSPLAYHPDI